MDPSLGKNRLGGLIELARGAQMRMRRFAMIMVSASLIFGLGGLVLASTTASAQGAPALKLSGGSPKPCSVKKDTITNGCSIKVKGSNWPKSAAVKVVECNAKVTSGDVHACSAGDSVTSGRTGRFSVRSFTVSLGTVGDGSCSASGTAPTCYVEATSGVDTVRASFTGGVTGGGTFTWDGFNWTTIVRHGEFTQGETECNIPGAVAVADNILTITTKHESATCGDSLNPPVNAPYTTGDVQWTSNNFTYGTVTYEAKVPAKTTSLWPAVWFLTTKCQATNVAAGETGYESCPQIYTSTYEEIDATECYQSEWCQLALAQPSSFPVCIYPVDTAWHTYKMIWSPTSVSITMDGQPTGCDFTSAQGYVIPHTPMFMIIQTQTGGSGGTPNNAELPAVFQVADVSYSSSY